MAVLLDNAFTNLRGRELLFLFESQGYERLIHADRAVRRVIVFKTTIETLVSKTLVAMAVTRQLRDRHRNLLDCAISLASWTSKTFRIESRASLGPTRGDLKKSRHRLHNRRCS